MGLVRIVEVAAYFILAFAVVAAVRRGQWRTLVREGLLVSAGGLLGELTIMRWYGFYRYDAGWSVFVDLMPVTVALIWGFVLVSARGLVGCLDARKPAWMVAALVLFDASLIEPVASRAGLWRWDEGGLFSVPWIGVLGWGLYAGFVSWCLDRPKFQWFASLLAPAATHLALLALWWGGFRWFGRAPAPEFALVVASVLVSLVLARFALRAPPPPLAVLLPRMPAGMLFFALLPALAPSPAFVAYVVPFALPWFVLTVRAWRARDGGAVA